MLLRASNRDKDERSARSGENKDVVSANDEQANPQESHPVADAGFNGGAPQGDLFELDVGQLE